MLICRNAEGVNGKKKLGTPVIDDKQIDAVLLPYLVGASF